MIVTAGWLCGGGFDGDGVAEGFELTDQVVLASLGVGVPVEVLGPEVVVVAVTTLTEVP